MHCGKKPATQDINRITVEFKFTSCNHKKSFSHILIESQWNLNEKITVFGVSQFTQY